MKYSLFIIVCFGLFYGCNNSTPNKSNNKISFQNAKDITAAQFYKNSLKTLDSIIICSESNDDLAGFEAVKILTEISGYEGGGNPTYFGTFGFNDTDLEYWKKWFENNKESLYYLYEPQNLLNDALNSELFHVIKVDTLKNGYLVYTRKNDSILKILSFHIDAFKNCENIKVGGYYDFKLYPFNQNTSNISSHRLHKFIFEKPNRSFTLDTNKNTFLSLNLRGLCYIK